MQTLFETENYHIYRNDGLTFLKNGVVNQINAGQCNTLLSKLYGLPNEQAEKVIASTDLKIVKKVFDYDVHEKHLVSPLIYQSWYNGEPKDYFTVRIKAQGKIRVKSFKTLAEAEKYRTEIKGELRLAKPQAPKLIERNLFEVQSMYKTVYRLKMRLKRNGISKNYNKTFNTLEEAREYRTNVKKK